MLLDNRPDVSCDLVQPVPPTGFIGQEDSEINRGFSRPACANRVAQTNHILAEHLLDLGNCSSELLLFRYSLGNVHKSIIALFTLHPVIFHRRHPNHLAHLEQSGTRARADHLGERLLIYRHAAGAGVLDHLARDVRVGQIGGCD